MSIENKWRIIMELEELLKFLDDDNFLNQVEGHKIPNINLYMDQVLTFMNENLECYKRNQDDKILTKSMINNYVKSNMIPKPENKKYYPQHIIAIIYIFYLKQILSLDDAKIVLKNYLDSHFNLEDMSSLYNVFLAAEKCEEEKIESELKELSNSLFDNFKEDYKDDEILFLFIMLLASRANTYKVIIERLLDGRDKDSSLHTKKHIKKNKDTIK